MKKLSVVASVMVMLVAVAVVFAQGFKRVKAFLNGYEEPPAVSSTGKGDFHATIKDDASAIYYELSYSDLEGEITQAHIHVGQRKVNGGISVWLCSNLASPPTPAGTQPCPAPPATISGTITPSDIVGPAGQGIAAGEFSELVQAIRSGLTYANVHTTKHPGGEVRGQISHDRRGHHNAEE